MERADYKPLAMSRMGEGVKCVASGYWYSTRLRADSPALDAMTDLRKVTPATIDASANLAQANQSMIARGYFLVMSSSLVARINWPSSPASFIVPP